MLLLVGMLLALGFWMLRDRGKDAALPAGDRKTADQAPVVIASLLRAGRLATSSRVEVASPNPVQFRSGAEIYAHFVLDKPAVLFVGLLDASLGLSALSPTIVDGLAGNNVLGPFEVEDGAGREAVMLLASETARTREDFARLLGRATDAVRGVENQFAPRLAAILTALRAHEGLHAEAIEYDHVR